MSLPHQIIGEADDDILRSVVNKSIAKGKARSALAQVTDIFADLGWTHDQIAGFEINPFYEDTKSGNIGTVEPNQEHHGWAVYAWDNDEGFPFHIQDFWGKGDPGDRNAAIRFVQKLVNALGREVEISAKDETMPDTFAPSRRS